MADQIHQNLPVHGYKPESQSTVDRVNESKLVEERILTFLDELYIKETGGESRRWQAIGKTHIEQGFMAINRAIFKPERVKKAENP